MTMKSRKTTPTTRAKMTSSLSPRARFASRVHLVLTAVSEQGVRLNIKKATLRHWRSEFARNLRLLGVQANATERAVRGETRKAKKDGIYRASLRGDSSHLRAQLEAVAAEQLNGNRH